MLVEHKMTGSVYYLDEFVAGIRLRNASTGEIRSMEEEDFKKNYHLVEDDILIKSSSLVDDIVKELKQGKKIKKSKKKIIPKKKTVIKNKVIKKPVKKTKVKVKRSKL